MKKFRVFVIIVILFSVIGFFKVLQNFTEQINYTKGTVFVSTTNSLQSIQEYYNVRACVSKYYYNMNDYYNDEDKEYFSKAFYNLLDEEYKSLNNITIDNILNEIYCVGDVDIYLEKLSNVQNIGNNIKVYHTNVEMRNIDTNEYKEESLKVLMDTENNTFSIIPCKNKNEFKIKTTSIAKNDNNSYSNYSCTMSDYTSDIIKQIKNYMLYNPKEAYDLLDSKFKKKSFESYEKFIAFIEENKREITLLNNSDYLVDYDKDITIYTFNNKSSKFKIVVEMKGVMEYNYSIE